MNFFINISNQKLFSLIFLILLSVCSSDNVLASEVKKTQANDRILFVGNSFSYFNNGLHNHVSSLVKASGKWQKGKSRFRLMTISGGKFEEHQAGLKSMLSNNQWDKVILQAYSNSPVSKKRKKTFIQGSQILSKMVREAGAEPVFFMTWGYKDKPAMTDALAKSYTAVANSLNAPVIPVGLAFKNSLQKYPEINLYSPDVLDFDINGNEILKKIVKHPSLEGTYLTACVFFAALYKQTPEGLPYTANLSADVVKRLQQVAWETVNDFKN